MDFPEFPDFPSLVLPDAPVLPEPVLEVPRAQVPTYKPLVVPPSDLRPPPGVKGEDGKEKEPKPQPKTLPIKNPDINYVQVPMIDQEIPLPSPEILATAGTTAVVSVAATLTATSMFKYLVMVFKPVLKQTWSKLTKKRNPSSNN
jgi:hypothetical protein